MSLATLPTTSLLCRKGTTAFSGLTRLSSSSCTTSSIITYRSRDNSIAKMTVTGVDMNRDGFQTCCNSLRLATALLYRMERLLESLPFSREPIIPEICRVETVLSWTISPSAFSIVCSVHPWLLCKLQFPQGFHVCALLQIASMSKISLQRGSLRSTKRQHGPIVLQLCTPICLGDLQSDDAQTFSSSLRYVTKRSCEVWEHR